MDYDVELFCGCVVAWNHDAWDWDLTDVSACTDGHTREEAIAIAAAAPEIR